MKAGEIAHSVSRGVFYLTIERVAALLSGTVYFAVILRSLGPTKYGIITLALSFTALATIATGNFEAYLERFAAEFRAREAFATLRRAHLLALALKLGLGFVAACLMLVLAPLLARQFHTPELTALMPSLSLMVAFDGLATTGRSSLYGMQRFRAVCALSVGFHVLKTVLVWALWFTHQGLPALALGLALLAVAQGIVSTAVPLWLLRHARDATPAAAEESSVRGLLPTVVRYCLPLMGARVTYQTGQNLGKVVLGKLVDSAQLGYFSFAFQTVERLVELVYTMPSSLLPSLTHLVTGSERERMRDIFDQAFRLIQVTACVLAFAVFAFAREVTFFMGSPLFAPAVPILRILALVPIARTAQQPLAMLFQAVRRPGALLTLALLKFGTELSCYFTLVPMLGAMGAGWANLAGEVVSYAIALVLITRILPEGARDRLRMVGVALAATLPLVVLALVLDRPSHPGWSLAARIALVPVGVAVLFTLELVQRYDLEKLAALPLSADWMRRPRDIFVALAGRLVHALAPRRAS